MRAHSRTTRTHARTHAHTHTHTHTHAVNEVGASLSLAEEAAPASVDGGEAPTYAASSEKAEAPLAANAYSSSGGGYQS